MKASAETMEVLSNLYGRRPEWFLGNLESNDNVFNDAITPLPWLGDDDQREFRDFWQVLKTKDTKSNGNDKVEELRSLVGGNRKVEELHEELNTYVPSLDTGKVNVIGAISRIGLTIILRPLHDVLGTLLRLNHQTGLLLSVLQTGNELRFAAANALSRLLNRSDTEKSVNLSAWYTLGSEKEVKQRNRRVFVTALDLLLPNYLIADLQRRQKWTSSDMVNPINIYQASLRLEASYHATVCAYQRLGCITSSESRKLLNVCTSDIKRELLEDCQIKEIDNVDVWRVSEDEVGTTIRAKQNDIVVLRLKQNGSAGYRWDIGALEDDGFSVLDDKTRIVNFKKIGTPSLRTVVSKLPERKSGEFVLEETCPWPRRISRSNVLTLKYRRLTEPKEGLYRSSAK